MRLSIALDDDLYAIAKSLAKAEECSLSAALNLLVRRAIEQPRPSDRTTGAIAQSTFPTSAGKRLITEDDVKDVEDEA